MDKFEIINVIVQKNMVDDICSELLKILIAQKNAIKEQNHERGASLKAISKIADKTKDIDAIMALCEE